MPVAAGAAPSPRWRRRRPMPDRSHSAENLAGTAGPRLTLGPRSRWVARACGGCHSGSRGTGLRMTRSFAVPEPDNGVENVSSGSRLLPPKAQTARGGGPRRCTARTRRDSRLVAWDRDRRGRTRVVLAALDQGWHADRRGERGEPDRGLRTRPHRPTPEGRPERRRPVRPDPASTRPGMARSVLKADRDVMIRCPRTEIHNPQTRAAKLTHWLCGQAVRRPPNNAATRSLSKSAFQKGGGRVDL